MFIYLIDPIYMSQFILRLINSIYIQVILLFKSVIMNKSIISDRLILNGIEEVMKQLNYSHHINCDVGDKNNGAECLSTNNNEQRET